MSTVIRCVRIRMLTGTACALVVFISLFCYDKCPRPLSLQEFRQIGSQLSGNDFKYVVWGWPMVYYYEMQVENNGVLGEKARVHCEFEQPSRIYGRDIKKHNQYWWLFIILFSFLNGAGNSSDKRFASQLSLRKLLAITGYICVFVYLSELQFFGYGYCWIMLIPISFGIYSCIVLPVRISVLLWVLVTRATVFRARKRCQVNRTN